MARAKKVNKWMTDAYTVLCELMSTWNRPDAMDFAAIMVVHIVPPYRALIERYEKAQSVPQTGRGTVLDRQAPGIQKK